MVTVEVGAQEANQHFSALLAAAQRDGDAVIITRRRRPVPRLVPQPVENQPNNSPEIVGAWVARYARASGNPRWNRDELYDRGSPKHSSVTVSR